MSAFFEYLDECGKGVENWPKCLTQDDINCFYFAFDDGLAPEYAREKFLASLTTRNGNNSEISS